MALPNNYMHGVYVNHNGTLKQPTSIVVNNNGTLVNPREIQIKNSGSLVQVWPPRAFIVELVPIGGYGTIQMYDVSTGGYFTKTGTYAYNGGNWNRLANATISTNVNTNEYTVYAFRLWTKYSSQNPLTLDFTGLNRIRRSGAATTGLANADLGVGHGGLWGSASFPSISYSDNRDSAPFVVIPPGSKMLCIRMRAYKSASEGSGEGEGGCISTVAMWSGNGTYFGGSGAPVRSTAANDLPGLAAVQQNMIVNAWSGAGGGAPSGGDGRSIAYPPYHLAGVPACSQHNSGKNAIATINDITASAFNSEPFFTSNNYTTTYSRIMYRFGGGGEDGFPGTVYSSTQTPNSQNCTLSSLSTGAINAGHVGWKYFGHRSYDGAESAGDVYTNYDIVGAGGGTLARGSTLFLVIPP